MQAPLIPRRLVLTSVNQLILLVRTNPELATQIPKFGNLATAPFSEAPKKSCNCGAKANITTPDANKQTAESILTSLTPEDFLSVKAVLNLNELCYYRRSADQSKLELLCV